MSIGVLVSGPLSGAICEWAQTGAGDVAAGYAVTFRLMILPIVLGALIFLGYNRRKQCNPQPVEVDGKKTI